MVSASDFPNGVNNRVIANSIHLTNYSLDFILCCTEALFVKGS